MQADVLSIKLVSRLRTNHLVGPPSAPCDRFDPTLHTNVRSIDLGHLFWHKFLSRSLLASQLVEEGKGQFSTAEIVRNDVGRELDHLALLRLLEAKQALASVSSALPSANSLVQAFRILTRAVGIASRHIAGIQVHLSRGAVSTDFDYWNLSEILARMTTPGGTSLQAYLDSVIEEKLLASAKIAVLNLRNDSELAQAVFVGYRIKQLSPGIVVILDAAGGNEQFSFASWVPILSAEKNRIRQALDYFLPQEDYKATLRDLVGSVLRGVSPALSPNLVSFSNVSLFDIHAASCLDSNVVHKAFEEYRAHQDCFLLAGDRAFVTRLSPGKCHWAACAFCTINAQHMLPRASATVDPLTSNLIVTLLDAVKSKKVRHLVLMDEALPPAVLFALAQAIVESKLDIVYRVRCRFSEQFSDDQCKLLFESGCRFLGLGLESASPRVNKLVNKHMGPPLDCMRILSRLSQAGIRPHVYSIMGFPTETPAEIQETEAFLTEAVRRHPYVTVSANTFHLMRGSGMYNEPARFGITTVQDRSTIALVLQFNESEHDSNPDGPRLAAQRVFQAQYLPDVDDKAGAESFWHFIDQTGIFYLQKVLLDENPYHALARERQIPPDFLDRCYSFAPLSLLKSCEKDEFVPAFSWITHNYVWVPISVTPLLARSLADISIRENIATLLRPDLFNMAAKVIRTLIVSGGLIAGEDHRVPPKTDRRESLTLVQP